MTKTYHPDFPSGFVFSKDSHLVKKYSPYDNLLSLNGINFSHDPNYCPSYYLENGVLVLLFGYMQSVLRREINQGLAAKYLACALIRSESEFFCKLKEMWGRFIVVCSSPRQGEFALGDATQMRTLFWSNEEVPVFSSHAPLLSRKKLDQFPSAIGYPGNYTPYEGVKALTPNIRIDLNTGKTNRFYPNLMKKDEIVAGNRELARKIVDLCAYPLKQIQKNPICCSITSGFDSRVTLAILKSSGIDLDGIRFFTYSSGKQDSSEADVVISKLIAQKLGLNHEILQLDEGRKEVNLIKKYKSVTIYNHKPYLIPLYRKYYHGFVHIRSNVYEIGRCFYRRKRYFRDHFGDRGAVDPGELYIRSVTYHEGKRGKARDFYMRAENRARCRKAFLEFLEVTEFQKMTKEYDVLDALYWEHRMGTWLPHSYTQSDFVFETAILVNNWMILENFLAAPVVERLSDGVSREILQLADPELAEFPVNPKMRTHPELFIA